jgi:hypothetical protein
MTVTNRPTVLYRTLASLDQSLPLNTCKVIANLDPVPSDDFSMVIEILEHFFRSQETIKPLTPNFAQAVKSVFERVPSNVMIFHLEDDWLIDKFDISIMHDTLVAAHQLNPAVIQCKLPYANKHNDKLFLCPAMWLSDYAKLCGLKLRIDLNPEFQLQRTKFKSVTYPTAQPRMLEDIGREWRKQQHLVKNNKGLHTQWELCSKV